MNRRLVIVLFVAGLIGLASTVIARFPLSLALAMSEAGAAGGASALRATGTIWDGQLERLALGAHVIGDVDLALDPRALPAGKARLAWRLRHSGLEGAGVLAGHPDGTVELSEARLAGRLLDLPTLVPLEGSFRLEVDRIVFGADGCRQAAASLWTDTLERSRASLRWRGPALEGSATCRDGMLVLPLAGSNDDSRIAIEARLRADLHYAIEISVNTENRRLLRTLPALGFEPVNNGHFRLIQDGRLPSRKETH